MDIKSYKDMIVWQKAMELAIEIYKLVKLLPKEETYAFRIFSPYFRSQNQLFR